MFGFINKMFIGLLASIVNSSSHKKCLLLSNQKCMTQPTIINLHPNEYTQGLRYYSFAVSLDRCARGSNAFSDLSNKVCVPNKTEDLNIHIKIKNINKSSII